MDGSGPLDGGAFFQDGFFAGEFFHVQVLLRERDGNAVFVERIIDVFPHGGKTGGFCHDGNPDPYAQIDGTVSEIVQHHAGFFNLGKEGQGSQRFQNDFTRPFHVRSVGNAHFHLHAFEFMVAGHVAEVFVEELGVLEGDDRAVQRLDHGGAVAQGGDAAPVAVAFNHVALAQAPQHQGEAADDILNGVFQGKADAHAQASHDHQQPVVIGVHDDERRKNEEPPEKKGGERHEGGDDAYFIIFSIDFVQRIFPQEYQVVENNGNQDDRDDAAPAESEQILDFRGGENFIDDEVPHVEGGGGPDEAEQDEEDGQAGKRQLGDERAEPQDDPFVPFLPAFFIVVEQIP